MSDKTTKSRFFVIVRVSNTTEPTEYWTGAIAQRKFHQYPEMTANITMARKYSNKKVAAKSANILYQKTESTQKFTVIQIEEEGIRDGEKEEGTN